MESIDRFFGIRASGSTLRREVVGGLTTFATMSYIVFVQPTILSAAGMPFGAVLVATCLSSATATLMMGLIARYPFALAPGMGENIFFAFTVCGAMGFKYPSGLMIVLIAGLLFLVLSLFGVRERIIAILPDALTNSIGPAIGLFIALVGLQWAGIVRYSPATMVTLGDMTSGPVLIAIAGVLISVALIARGVGGGLLIGILATTGLGLLTGVVPWPAETSQPSFDSFFALSFAGFIDHWQHALLAIALLFFMDLFDTVGTLVGVGRLAGFMDDDGRLPRAGHAFFCDAAGTCLGAIFGTSTVTTYIESAAGVAAGARTGLAAVVTSACFLVAMLFAPIVRVVGQDLGPAYYGVDPATLHVAMYPCVAPALIVVGCLMLRPLLRVKWDDITEALPAFLTLVVMPFAYAIHEGIAVGIISYAAVKVISGRGRDVHWALYGIATLLVLRYVVKV